MVAHIWQKEIILTRQGEIEAAAPLIISASRATDIPAFYARWLLNRFAEGYLRWINPFNGKSYYISLAKARFIVFWSKNPGPLLPLLPHFDKLGLQYYLQFTLNNYEKEGLECNLPVLAERLQTFITLAERLGKERVIWRFDPLIIGGGLTLDGLVERIKAIGERIQGYTEKLVFSFVDIGKYRKVQLKIKKQDSYREFTRVEKEELAEKLACVCQKLGFKLYTCAEERDLSVYGVKKNRCIDGKLIARLSSDDELLCLLSKGGVNQTALKDKGQRPACGCIASKDIGQYNTCPHLCSYCYANASEEIVLGNCRIHTPWGETIIPMKGETS